MEIALYIVDNQDLVVDSIFPIRIYGFSFNISEKGLSQLKRLGIVNMIVTLITIVTMIGDFLWQIVHEMKLYSFLLKKHRY